jgi:hypothetical protein
MDHRTVKAHIERHRDMVMRRMKARDERRPPWNGQRRQRFLEEFWHDHPGHPDAVELADSFEAAIDEAHCNPAWFSRELDRRLA